MKQFSQQQDEGPDSAVVQRGLNRVRKIFAGNGVSGKAITLSEWEGKTYTLRGSLSLKPAARVREEHLPGRQSVGEVVSRGDAMRAARSYAETVGQQEEFRAAVRSVLRQQPGQGFGHPHEPIVMEGATRIFSEHENCRACQGDGKLPCTVCQARGQKTCDKCRGMREGPCYVCKGTGTTDGPNGANTVCYACQGRRNLDCDLCRGTGQVPCPNCQSTGRAVCTTCQGQGAATRAVHVAVDAVPSFSIDPKGLPSRLVEFLERHEGHDLAVSGDIEVQMKSPQAQPESYYERQASTSAQWAEEYEAECLWGKLSIDLGGKSISCFLLGRRGRVVDCPDFLDSLLRPVIGRLQEAAKGARPAAEVLERGARYRIVREILPILLSKGKKKAARATRKAYPFGISDHAIKTLLLGLSGVIARMTRFPAWLAALVGVGIGAMVLLGWFVFGLRQTAMAGLPMGGQFMGDLALLGAVCLLGVLGIRLAERQFLKRVFTRLKLPPRLVSRLPRAGASELALILALCAVCVGVLFWVGPAGVSWLGMIGR